MDTQLLDVNLLTSDHQESMLALEAVDGVAPMTERARRAVVRGGILRAMRAIGRSASPSAMRDSPSVGPFPP